MIEIGKRVLQGLIGTIDVLAPLEISDTEHLLRLARELQNEEERLISNFPAATKVVDPDDECRSTDNEGIAEDGCESESSDILVKKDECMTQ